MNSRSNSSGPRGGLYAESKFTNWVVYDPFFAEARAMYKRFDDRMPSVPAFPRVISQPPLDGFIHACGKEQVEARLKNIPSSQLTGLRAVFLLSGTRKQEQSWRGKLACYGMYWYSKTCIFLFAHPFDLGRHNLDSIRDFYLDDVLLHEIAHHVDRVRFADRKTKEGFAHAFVQQRHG